MKLTKSVKITANNYNTTSRFIFHRGAKCNINELKIDKAIISKIILTILIRIILIKINILQRSQSAYHFSLSLVPAENVEDFNTSPISSRQKLKLFMVHM